MSDPPRVLIIGTGQMGVMEVPDKVLNKLAEAGVDAEPMPTEKALQDRKSTRLNSSHRT